MASNPSPQAMAAQGLPGLWDIFSVFFSIGITAYGGPAMLPFIRRRVVDKEKWLSEESFRQGLAICQTIPGGTLMQLSAYVGLRLCGLPGALVAFIGFAMPAFLLITGMSVAYFHYRELPFISAVFNGLQVVMIAIVALAVRDFLSRYTPTWIHRGLAAVAAVAFLCGLNPFLTILGAAVAGALLLGKASPTPPARMPPAAHTTTGLAALTLASMAGVILLKLTDPLLFDLAISMFKVDLFAFGGFGAFPMLHHEVVNVHAWLDEKTFLDGIALGQVTPGPILLTSAFVGWWLRGMVGAMVAGVAVFTPSFLMLLAAVPFCDRLLLSPSFRAATQGILATLGGLIAGVGIKLAMTVPWDVPRLVLLAAASAALWKGVDVLWVVLAGACTGFLLLGG